ncbi:MULTISPECIES: flagellar basal-body MS-ring/collar protein FliF [Asticcacaulis]|uniref:flagellar basal-body MS-ring/collar protein FliF n=1 Tax=Asticcacaulis TaxID=76890 RepID=UPI001AE7B8B6|nr:MULTISPECIES: flagellar basal-body MS-ring/collar protein FliF [Asticcacaulis]MBP2161177.1 flagellar M-ring protein FliF [Asticcacaulis solisilvae]MDR6802222.1 flagellar M-ring protein FliF [Asticcacaulis sp. BE141]
MDSFDKIRSMPPQRQILLAVGVVVIAVFLLGSVYFVFLRKPDVILFSNLRPTDAATIVAELDKKKVPYRLADDGTTILVSADKVDATRLGILSQDLPLKGSVGFELFNKSDIGLTEFAQKINYQRALQGELSRTIMAIDAVDTARVHLSLPEDTIFRDDKRSPKASIALTLKPGRSLSTGAVLGIQRLVAASVAELNAADVVVLDGEGQVISTEISSETSTAQSPAQHAAEVFFAEKVRQTLFATYPGQEFTVRVTALPVFRPVESDDADAEEEPSDPFLQWTAGQRNFQLKVSIAGPAARNAEAQQNIRVAAAAAIDIAPELGDEIVVTAAESGLAGGVPAESGRTVAATGAAAASTTSRNIFGPTFWGVVVVLVLAGLAFAALQVLRNRARPPVRTLTEEERREFAQRFQVLLERGEGNAVDRL